MFIDIVREGGRRWQVSGLRKTIRGRNRRMQSTSNVAAEKTGPAKLSEKLAEKRRALGRGLESLLPGPRVVPVPAPPTLPQSTRQDGAPAASSQFPVLGSQEGGPSLSSSDGGGVRAGTPVAPLKTGTVLDELRAVASGLTADGETIFLVGIDLIDPNPYQTPRDFNEKALEELRESIAVQGGLQPMLMRPGPQGRFILILGERRVGASRGAGEDTDPGDLGPGFWAATA